MNKCRNSAFKQNIEKFIKYTPATQDDIMASSRSPTFCKYCNQPLDPLDENHLMQTCAALNKYAEPVSAGSSQLTPYAYRHASMTLINPSSSTPRRNRGRVKE